MTVEDLRDILKELPHDAEIKFLCEGGQIEYINDWWMEDGELILG